MAIGGKLRIFISFLKRRNECGSPCMLCSNECPIDAIKADSDESVEDMEKWLLINKKFSAKWPNISKKKEPMAEHEKFKEIKNKYDKYFSEKPGK